MPPQWLGRIVLALSSVASSGCLPDLGECDLAAAEQLTYTDDDSGFPAYQGQALVISSCGGGAFCHAEEAIDRYGAPGGLDFDLNLASTAGQMDRLRADLETARSFRREILKEVLEGRMPPGEAGQDVVNVSPRYRDLPPIDDAAGREILRNWLACDLPVVERIADDRPVGEVPIGDIVPPMTAIVCGTGLSVCGGACVAIESDPDHCGGCDVVCGLAELCAGSCMSGCPGGTTVCGRSCVDTSTSPLHCGDCDRNCPFGSVCTAGECACEGGGLLCGGGCVDTATSRAHCGRCDNPCGTSEACRDGACVECGTDISFSRDVVPIFTQSCTDSMCHAGRRPAQGIDLTAAAAHDSLVGVASDCGDGRLLVEPGAPDGSYLVDKLRGRNLCGGVRMPNREDPLPEATIARIEEWICGGARND